MRNIDDTDHLHSADVFAKLAANEIGLSTAAADGRSDFFDSHQHAERALLLQSVAVEYAKCATLDGLELNEEGIEAALIKIAGLRAGT